MVSRPLLSLPHILNDCCLSDLHPLLNKVPVLSVRLCLFELSDVLTGWQQLRDIFCCHFHPLCCKDRGVGRRARGDLCDPSVSPPTFRDSHCCCLSVCLSVTTNRWTQMCVCSTCLTFWSSVSKRRIKGLRDTVGEIIQHVSDTICPAGGAILFHLQVLLLLSCQHWAENDENNIDKMSLICQCERKP